MTTHALVHKQPAEVDQIMDQIRNHSLQWIEQLAETGNRGDLEGLVSRLFNDIRFFKELVDQSDHGGPRPCQDIAKEIHRFMSTNLHQGLTLKALAKFLGYSEKYRSELFQMRMGQPFSQYLKRLRVDEAKRLLEIGDLSLTHIALRLGFSDQFAFSHFFKRTLGYSPTQFRKASAAGAAGLIHGADQIFHFMPVIRNGHIQQNFGRLSDLQPPDM